MLSSPDFWLGIALGSTVAWSHWSRKLRRIVREHLDNLEAVQREYVKIRAEAEFVKEQAELIFQATAALMAEAQDDPRKVTH